LQIVFESSSNVFGCSLSKFKNYTLIILSTLTMVLVKVNKLETLELIELKQLLSFRPPPSPYYRRSCAVVPRPAPDSNQR